MGAKQQGFSLIESLVAMLIMAVGLLGVVALQTQALSQQRSAYLDTQATNMAQDMLDRIRANPEAASAYRLSANETANGSDLAARDKQAWMQDLATVLPSGQGHIDVNLPRVEVSVEFEDTTSARVKRQITLATEL